MLCREPLTPPKDHQGRPSRTVQTVFPRRSLRYSVLSCFPPRGPVSPLDWAITIHDPLYPPVPSSSWGPAPSSRVPFPLGPPQRSRPTHLPSGDTVLPSRVPSVLQGHLQGHPLLTNVLQDWRRQWHPTPVLLSVAEEGYLLSYIWVYLSFSPLLFASLLFTAICKEIGRASCRERV